jgi:hypothetical protein
MAETISTISLPPPEQFLPHAGEPIIPWERYKLSFETYMLATGLNVVSPERKKAILFHCLSAEGLCIFQTLAEAYTYDAAVELWTDILQRNSVLLKRLHFRQRA